MMLFVFIHVYTDYLMYNYFFVHYREIKYHKSHGGRRTSLSGSQCCLEHGMVGHSARRDKGVLLHWWTVEMNVWFMDKS